MELALPTVEHGEVLVEVEACAVCRTDLQLCDTNFGAEAGQRPVPAPKFGGMA
jgi:D-arabinose 1-dehydrogenase-like Zn-dependent alcohol dehydrogenase